MERGRPYRVEIAGNQAAVSTESDDGEQDYDSNPVLITFFQRIWIGGDDWMFDRQWRKILVKDILLAPGFKYSWDFEP